MRSIATSVFRSEAIAAEHVSRSFRGELFDEQNLRTIDIANTGDRRLIEEQLADRRATSTDATPGLLDIGVFAKWIGAESTSDGILLLWRVARKPVSGNPCLA
jgi:hypothetical protein